jgi:hypothetical protein
LAVVDTSRISQCIVFLKTSKIYAVTRYGFYTAIYIIYYIRIYITQRPSAFLVCILHEIYDCAINPEGTSLSGAEFLTITSKSFRVQF